MSYEPINKAAYEVFSKMDEDEAKLILSAIVYDTLPPYIEENTPLIQKHVDAWISKRLSVYDRYLKRQYVDRIKKDLPTDDLEEAYTAISKAFQDTLWETNPSEAMRLHPRDPKGRWRESPYKIVLPVTKKPISNPEKAGIPNFTFPKGTSDAKKAEMQSAFTQIASTLGMYEKSGLGGEAQVRIFSPGARGQFGSTKVIAGTDITSHLKELAENGRVPTDYVVAIPAETSVAGVYYDALSAIPGVSQPGALGIHRGGQDLPGNMPGFSSDWFSDAYSLSDNEPRFRRLKAGSELIDTFVPQSAIKTKAALAGAKYVGELGPDAEKIVGPTARKLTYRSRGTEKKTISPELRNVDATDRNRAILGYGQPTIRRDGQIKMGGDLGTIPEFFRGRLPNKDYWELQRKSGAVPPSEGVVIDSSGKVISQSVGFKDDHYLPFNLKALSKLRGGEYVRTRSTGGPTTEDVYTALISGAAGFTVISRSGAFTVDFDPSFTGRRRYNDKAGKMVERYGKLLDAAGSGEVTLKDVDEERYSEIVEQARETTTNREDYKHRLSALLDEEKFKPKASARMREDAFTKAQTQVLEETINGTGQFAARYNQLKSNSTPPEMLRAIVNKEAEERSNGILREELKKRSFKAMQLDGEGYYSSLQALKEQYPYYIKEIHYHPLNKERDQGYVKPKYLRPDEVWDGYFDPDIKGSSKTSGGRTLNSLMVRSSHQEGEHGKVRASGTNYQNFRIKDPREQAAQDAETKATQGVTQGAPAATPAGAIDAKERQVQQLADAYKAYVGTAVNVNGELRPYTSDEIDAFGIDIDDPVRSIRNMARDESDFMTRFSSALHSHRENVARARVMYSDNSQGSYQKYKSALDAYDREVAPKIEIPEGGPPGLVALDNPDKVLNFPEINSFDDPDIEEALKHPTVAVAAAALSARPGGSMTDKATDRLRELSDAMTLALRDRPADTKGATPEMQRIEQEAAAVARLKALLTRREQLGGSEAFQSTQITGSGDVLTRRF